MPPGPRHLDVPLAQAVQVGTDAHRSTGDIGQGEGVLGDGCGSGHQETWLGFRV